MDIAELLEAERRKEAAAEEERNKQKAESQLRNLCNEKRKWISKTNFQIKRNQFSLRFLEVERDREIENYLATQSESIENKYRQQENVVKDLVRTTDLVKSILESEKQANRDMQNKISGLERAELQVKADLSATAKEHNRFRIPDEKRMNDRVELAASRFNYQMAKNRRLEEKIDELVFVRKCCHTEVLRLERQLKELNNEVFVTMNEIAELSETRDRIEATQVKVRDHLTKVKDRYQRELLGLALNISDSKETEAFMRTKHKDITQYLTQQRELALEKVKAMLAETDEFQKAFISIRQTTGEEDMFVVVKNFLETEDNNFITFLKINEMMNENETLKTKSSDILTENVKMENATLEFMSQRKKNIKEVERQIETYKQKSDTCLNKLAQTGKKLDTYINHIKTMLKILQIPMKDLHDAVGPTGEIAENSILPCMAIVEQGVSELLHDYYMLELSIRARPYKRPSECNHDELMLLRVPSLRIVEEVLNTHSHADFSETSPDKEETDKTLMKNNTTLLGVSEIKEMVVKEMLQSGND